MRVARPVGDAIAATFLGVFKRQGLFRFNSILVKLGLLGAAAFGHLVISKGAKVVSNVRAANACNRQIVMVRPLNDANPVHENVEVS